MIQARCTNITPFDVEQYEDICNFSSALSHLPLTYPQLLAAPLHYQIITHPRFPFPGIGLVHVEQLITSHIPIPKETTVSITTWCDNLQQVRSGHHFSLHTEVFLDDKLAWKGESIILTRSLPGHQKTKNPQPSKKINNLKQEKIFVPENMGRQYAGISKDWNLIHVHWIFAKMFGFQRSIVHGMWMLAKAISWGSEHGLDITACHAKFIRPVFLPSSIHLAIQEGENDATQIQVLRDDNKSHLNIEILQHQRTT